MRSDTSDREGFDPVWLERREPVDHRSRAPELLPLLLEAWHRARWRRVLDLGAGTGSNIRYLAPELPDDAEWTALDHDRRLLQRIETRCGRPVRLVEGDLMDRGLTEIAHANLVTASALLDLMPESWMRDVVAVCRRHNCGALFAMSYDGATEWQPDREADVRSADEMIRQAVNAHQRRQQGERSAMGPDAPQTTARLFEQAGYRTWLVPSPWQLGPDDRELVVALIEGWMAAALEVVDVRDAVRLRQWAARRHETVRREPFRLTVGHKDLLALPDTAS